MEKENKRFISYISRLFIVVIFVMGFFVILSKGYQVNTNITYDMSKNRSVKAVHLVSKYIPEQIIPEVVETKTVSSIEELLKYVKTNPVNFQGTMTGYGPDCEGCGGRVSCPPRPNVKNGNIYYNDSQYGKIRIVAADKNIPCGTIVKVDGVRNYGTFYAIVLDRGGVIKGTLFDLLFASEKESSALGRANAVYTIARWGW